MLYPCSCSFVCALGEILRFRLSRSMLRSPRVSCLCFAPRAPNYPAPPRFTLALVSIRPSAFPGVFLLYPCSCSFVCALGASPASRPVFRVCGRFFRLGFFILILLRNVLRLFSRRKLPSEAGEFSFGGLYLKWALVRPKLAGTGFQCVRLLIMGSV